MERLYSLIAQPGSVAETDRSMLTEWVEKYPWFIPPKLLLLRIALDQGDESLANRMRNALALRLAAYPTPGVVLPLPDLSSLQQRNTREIIDEFLAVVEKKIVPNDNDQTGGKDMAAESSSNSDEDIVSETLAQIYHRQGLHNDAIRIYRQLSLKFPEKSVYFADIIEKISRKE